MVNVDYFPTRTRFLDGSGAADKYTVAVDFLHWITGRVLATRTVAITAS